MLDVPTLRVTLAMVSIVVLTLFMLGVYLPTRSKFALWWCVALLCSAVSVSLLLMNGTDYQVVTNPTASVISVLGGVSVWFAARSLLYKPALPFAAGGAAIAVAVAAGTQDPGNNIWAGNLAVFIVMAAAFGAASFDIHRAWRIRRNAYDSLHDGQARVAMVVSGVGAGMLSVFYTVRWVLLLVLGAEDEAFLMVSGAGPTTLVLLTTLVGVTFSIASLGYDQQTQELRRSIAHDSLTGVLSRATFLESANRVQGELKHSEEGAAVVIADLDHFKLINDTYGHGVGDHVLKAFGDALVTLPGDAEFAGRLGGEEFGVVLRGDDLEQMQARLKATSKRFIALCQERVLPQVTVSYGLTPLRQDLELSQMLGLADEAMYSAKEMGRDQSVIARQQMD
ncbi:GGDEF domain-containing protein [Demequina sediminicola]|uniref:GGDEF domain-containing protein n=1 Tax=Demequina sediminicola TaxID=1095026 RepID=UPI000782D088|nr:GGDEF domain-containing protein [Demequina sediminicola]